MNYKVRIGPPEDIQNMDRPTRRLLRRREAYPSRYDGCVGRTPERRACGEAKLQPRERVDRPVRRICKVLVILYRQKTGRTMKENILSEKENSEVS